MNHDEALAKSRELDRFLVQAKKELTMPPMTGTRRGIASIKDLMRPVEDAMDELRMNLRTQAQEFAEEVRENGKLLVKKVADEHADARQQFAEMLGNEHAGQTDDVEGKPQG